jgi:hypothetical protein
MLYLKSSKEQNKKKTTWRNYTMTTYNYCPEMNQSKPHHKFYDGEVQASYNWKYQYIVTPLELKGRGITLQGVIDPKNYISAERIAYKIGWNEYKVTNNAFAKLEQQYKFVREELLD